ncbi:hypothetical protein DBT_1843 [Dissulfuribacter thermophilus]|uniref:Uncharacterized protein n=1 Tax=Dissulfuribacter thermophilus TaxID=1156395 RepID=A0A1B9F4J8_9BACT|nr:hypothetical protein [Dissulfuribacter thermophilus]OCC14783.1 hypothetical protein DBT_1843 [Dissulfuribacter thermophilus]
MELKEKIKKEIDLIPEEYLPQLEQYLKIIKSGKRRNLRIKTVHLKGKYDNANIRKLAYE